jgi:hypothetical protein
MGATSLSISRAIGAGKRDPRVQAWHRYGRRVRASTEEVSKALTGNWRDEHLFVSSHALAICDDIARRLHKCNGKLQTLLGERCRAREDLGDVRRPGSKSRIEFDVRQSLANWAGVDLTHINGLGVTVVMKRLTEPDQQLSRFAAVKFFCSWHGRCPDKKISGGKVLSSSTKRSTNQARHPLKMAAMSLSQRLRAGRLPPPIRRAMDKLRANTATAHKLCPDGVLHPPPAANLSSSKVSSATKTNSAGAASPPSSKRCAGALGFQLNPTNVAV